MGEGNAGLWFKIAFGVSKENFLENIIIVTCISAQEMSSPFGFAEVDCHPNTSQRAF